MALIELHMCLLLPGGLQVAQLQAAAAAAGANVAVLRAQLVKAERGATDSRELKEQVQVRRRSGCFDLYAIHRVIL